VSRLRADARERPGPFVLPFADPHLTVDDPGGLVRPPDRGHDEDLETLAEEMGRLEQLTVVRHDAPVRETLEDGGIPGATDSGDALSGSRQDLVWLYPEWDAGRAAYRNPGCRVRELPPAGSGCGASPTATISTWPAGWMTGRTGERGGLRKAASTRRSDRAAARSPSRCCSMPVARRRAGSPDASASSTWSRRPPWPSARPWPWVGDRFALLAFSGQGAADVRVRVLKRFAEPPGPTVQRRIGALEPDAFTRLGGALRHATAGLARERARARLLLVLSDGKPQDEDGYEGRYGIEDVRQAVAEARLQGIRGFGVTVDREGPSYLPRLFGPHGYTVIWNAELLPERLPAIYRRHTADA
jgi:nitric oxide reductase NorD protein